MQIDLHEVPTGDSFDHETADDCPCGPTDRPLAGEDGSVSFVAVHHSLDGRQRLKSEKTLIALIHATDEDGDG